MNGDWRVHHRRLRGPLSGSTEWYEEEGPASNRLLFDDAISIDEMCLADGHRGLSLRLREPGTDTWTIYWVNSTDNRLQAPVTGSWQPDGVFVGTGADTFAGRPIRASYRWYAITPDSARWEQHFSADGGSTWELNWVMSWSRHVREAR